MNKLDWQDGIVGYSQRKKKGFGTSAKPTESRDTRIRIRVLWGIYVVFISIIAAKILYLQLIERSQHELTSYANHVELIREVAPRGIVYDRMGIALTENVSKDDKFIRKYPLQAAIAPILGYIAQTRADELGCREGLCYELGSFIGRAGIEQQMESSLKGRDGGRLVEIDSSGREIRELGNNKAEPGQDVLLSIDSRLQKIMYDALHGRKGSAVALDMQGRVLGLVSSPSYDPEKPADYLSDKEQLYFLNRATSATYPPGSIFKLVTSLAGLAEGKLTSETMYEDTGEIKIGIYRYGNWYFDQYGRKEGNINLVRALARSNDIFFYKVGESIGEDSLVNWATKLGLGVPTGIELLGERSGLVPDELWKERITGEKWFLGNTYHMAIGQGDLLVTPLQAARMTLGAVSGRLCKVSVLKNSEVACSDIGVKTENLELVREGMREACATGGTAFPFFEFEPRVICKTGTAQHSDQKTDEDLPHAWITVAYPGDNPEMILTVMLEAAGEGSAEAGPVAKEILSGWRDIGK